MGSIAEALRVVPFEAHTIVILGAHWVPLFFGSNRVINRFFNLRESAGCQRPSLPSGFSPQKRTAGLAWCTCFVRSNPMQMIWFIAHHARDFSKLMSSYTKFEPDLISKIQRVAAMAPKIYMKEGRPSACKFRTPHSVPDSTRQMSRNSSGQVSHRKQRFVPTLT